MKRPPGRPPLSHDELSRDAAEIAAAMESAVERALVKALADLADRSPEFRDGYAQGFREAAIIVLGGKP